MLSHLSVVVRIVLDINEAMSCNASVTKGPPLHTLVMSYHQHSFLCTSPKKYFNTAGKVAEFVENEHEQQQ